VRRAVRRHREPVRPARESNHRSEGMSLLRGRDGFIAALVAMTRARRLAQRAAP